MRGKAAQKSRLQLLGLYQVSLQLIRLLDRARLQESLGIPLSATEILDINTLSEFVTAGLRRNNARAA